MQAEHTLKYFQFQQRQLDLLVVCTRSLTACGSASLLVGHSFETSTVPNLKFPNYDSACELSYDRVLFYTETYLRPITATHNNKEERLNENNNGQRITEFNQRTYI